MDPRNARRAVASTLIAGIVADALFDRAALGVSVPLATAAVLALVTWFGSGPRPADRLDLWLPGVAVAASLGPALRTDPTVVTLDLLLVVASTAAWSFAVSGVAVSRRTATAAAGLGAWAAAAFATGFVWLLARAGADGFLADRSRNLGRLAPIARGALVAIPIVAGFGLLLTSADAVFGRALDVALHLPFDLDDVARRAIFSIFAAALVAGPLALAAGMVRIATATGPAPAPDPLPATGPESPRAAEPQPPGATARRDDEPRPSLPVRRGGATETLVILIAVDVLFTLFAVVQVLYLFGGADTLAAVGMTFSDYARQGYFQLVGVVALAGLLLLGAHEVMGRTRAFVVAAMALLILTGLILASAAFRLGLYQGAYGWTELRFFVAASIVWLAACVTLAVILLAGDRMRWLPHGLAISATVVTLLVSALGPQAFVMDQNLARVLDPRLVAPGGHAGLDLEYGLTLGDDAIPALVAALGALPAGERMTLLSRLHLRREALALEATTEGPLSWNLARQRAREALTLLPVP